MRKQLPLDGTKRIRYPFAFFSIRIGDYCIKFERYKLTERYDAFYERWIPMRKELDDRANIITDKEEVKTFGGPY